MRKRPTADVMLEMNQALILGSLRQHELAAVAEAANTKLQAEIGLRIQSERDALTLTREISHRIKNNLQTFVVLIANEIARTAPEHAKGYIAMQARIGAIAELYSLISRSGETDTVQLDAYLHDIATGLRAALLEPLSGIEIVVAAQAVAIDPDRAEPFGLLVNELATNSIRHGFPGGVGCLNLRLEQSEDEIELTVADNGVGMELTTATPGQHGSDYVQIFVRQLGGRMATSESTGGGVTVKVWFPGPGILHHAP